MISLLCDYRKQLVQVICDLQNEENNICNNINGNNNSNNTTTTTILPLLSTYNNMKLN